MAQLWKDEYRIGVDKIDEQHYQLFEKIGNLVEIAQTSGVEDSRKECLDIIDFLIEYTLFHFETEESYQRDRQYVSYDQHIKIHEDFKNTVVSYKELLEKDFSAQTLKKFIGTLVAWLVNHVCVCDRRIVKNIPLSRMESFSDEEGFIKNVANKLLADMYDIPILEAKTCIYKGSVDGAVIIRTVAEGSRRHLFLYGMAEQLAGVLYNRISGMSLGDIGQMDDIDKSAFMEIGNIISTYAMSAIEEGEVKGVRFDSCLYVHGYNEDAYNLSNGVLVEIMTEFGKMDVLYCPLGQNMA